MKHFFSIEINHEYDRINENTIESSNHLSIVPASSNSLLVNNARLWFRTQLGFIDCYIEDNEAIKNETSVLFFWVICTDSEFFSYTDYADKINFSTPYYYWSNSEGGTTLKERDFCDLHPGKPPKMTIGCIGISISDIVKKMNFTIEFKTRRTLWTYSIVDEFQPELKEGNEKWTFEMLSVIEEVNSAQEKHKMIFQSTEPIPYFKKASNRFKLKWGPKMETRFEKDQEMIIPFANYTYKMVREDNKELTPVYIYI